MKNSIFKKLVALSLAVLMLVGSGIGAALAGIDLAGLVGIKASAEDPHNDIFYDEENGLFFEVVDGQARILGSDREDVLDSSCFEDGVYTLPNKVTNSLTGVSYYVFKLAEFSLSDIRLDVKKLIIPDNFRALTIPEASFAGWDNLTDVQWNAHNAVVTGPLFELLCSYSNDVLYDNYFIVRDSYGQPVFNDDNTELLVRVYSGDYHDAFHSSYEITTLSYSENIDWHWLMMRNMEGGLPTDELFTFETTDQIITGGYYGHEANNYRALIDGNPSFDEAKTVVMHKSPVTSFVFGENVKKVPDYICYDLEIESIDLSNVTAVGNYSFLDCNAIQTIDLSGIDNIGSWAFASCDGLTTLDLGNVNRIGVWAFAACDGITELTIPDGVENLGGGAFSFCDYLTTVIINDSACDFDTITVTLSEFGYAINSGGSNSFSPFSECERLTTFVFGKDVYTIPSNVGLNVGSLNKIIFLANDVPTTIEDHAFRYSDNINEIEVVNPDNWSSVIVQPHNDSILFDDITIKKHQHIFETKTVAATCSSEGYTVEICLCGTENGRSNPQPKLAHTLPDTPNTHIDASCEGQGYDLYNCTVCGEGVKKNVQPALEHDYLDTKTYPASCTEAGKTVGVCSRCQKEVVLETLPALNHDFGAYSYNNDATATRDGTETARCSRCGVTNTRTVPGTKTGDRLSNAAMSAGEEKDVEYSSKVVVTSRGYNIPSDYHLGIVANGKLVAEGTNEEVTYTADEVTEDTTFLTYIYDANGKIATKNPHKTDVAKVNNGFFARIIAFFKALFGLLPTVNFGK